MLLASQLAGVPFHPHGLAAVHAPPAVVPVKGYTPGTTSSLAVTVSLSSRSMNTRANGPESRVCPAAIQPGPSRLRVVREPVAPTGTLSHTETLVSDLTMFTRRRTLPAARVDERVPDRGGGLAIGHPPDQPAIVERELGLVPSV